MNNVVKVLGSLFMMVSATANAALISDNSFVQAGFKDTSTGLVWMDFGINNGQSYNYVSSQLASGGEYSGWRLPSADEVYLMWQNVASLPLCIRKCMQPSQRLSCGERRYDVMMP